MKNKIVGRCIIFCCVITAILFIMSVYGGALDGGGVGLSILFGIILFLLLNYFISADFFEIAIEKGYNNKKYFWYCFIFSWIGYLMVIALPNKTVVKDSVNDEFPEL